MYRDTTNRNGISLKCLWTMFEELGKNVTMSVPASVFASVKPSYLETKWRKDLQIWKKR